MKKIVKIKQNESIFSAKFKILKKNSSIDKILSLFNISGDKLGIFKLININLFFKKVS